MVARLGAAPGADVVATAPKPSPLADAVQRGDASTIQALLKKKIDVNAPQANGATALHWAAYRETPSQRPRSSALAPTSISRTIMASRRSPSPRSRATRPCSTCCSRPARSRMTPSTS